MRLVRGLVLAAVIAGAACGQRLAEPPGPAVPALTALEQLGKSVFFDQRLSLRGNQSCAACHAPQVGWTGDRPLVNAGPAVYEGSVSGLFSNRKPPTVAYAMAPVLHTTVEDGETLFVGGNFWDGRATGERLGDPIAEQAQGPFVNPVEQALPDTGCVVRRVCAADYPVTLESRFPGSCGIAWPPDVDAACALPAGTLPDGATGSRNVRSGLRSHRNGRCGVRTLARGQSVFLEVRSVSGRRSACCRPEEAGGLGRCSLAGASAPTATPSTGDRTGNRRCSPTSRLTTSGCRAILRTRGIGHTLNPAGAGVGGRRPRRVPRHAT